MENEKLTKVQKKLIRAENMCKDVVKERNDCENKNGIGNPKCNILLRNEKECLANILCPTQAKWYFTKCTKPITEYGPKKQRTCRQYNYDLTGCMHKYFQDVKSRKDETSFERRLDYERTDEDDKILQNSGINETDNNKKNNKKNINDQDNIIK
eukprot:TRINITY_DN2_c5_g1_i1.p1 TRINITY_DN2_c5_g1~~TRINITY_DN2_c5_g1_i1.p1  ORF type:complete len:154 (+),score=37.07 TRINITY_DN2_c5_g1_i1:89-550(+)